MTPVNREARAMRESWAEWRRQVVALIRCEFRDALSDIGEDDVDWDAWRPLYEEGCSPRSAVDQAFTRVPA
jgi:hypothetical protein